MYYASFLFMYSTLLSCIYKALMRFINKDVLSWDLTQWLHKSVNYGCLNMFDPLWMLFDFII